MGFYFCGFWVELGQMKKKKKLTRETKLKKNIIKKEVFRKPIISTLRPPLFLVKKSNQSKKLIKNLEQQNKEVVKEYKVEFLTQQNKSV